MEAEDRELRVSSDTQREPQRDLPGSRGVHPRPPSVLLNFVVPLAAVLALLLVVRGCQPG